VAAERDSGETVRGKEKHSWEKTKKKATGKRKGGKTAVVVLGLEPGIPRGRWAGGDRQPAKERGAEKKVKMSMEPAHRGEPPIGAVEKKKQPTEVGSKHNPGEGEDRAWEKS